MKNLSTGTGLALLATAIVAYPFVNRISSVDKTAHASVPVAAIATAATAQASPEPTIVWYGISTGGAYGHLRLLRAWSNGRIEAKSFQTSYGCLLPMPGGDCDTWQVLSDSQQGYSARSDISVDERVDGADLAQLLADFGEAPRQDIRPSDCPLNLINP